VAALVRMRGELCASAEAVLQNAWQQVRDERIKTPVLDFSRVTRIDSPGVNLLVKLCVQAKRSRRRLLAAGLSPSLKEVFRLTGLEGAVAVHSSAAEALDALGIAGEDRPQLPEDDADAAPMEQGQTDDAFDLCWARPVARLTVSGAPPEAANLNVDGRRPVGPLQGFGPMWEKTYRLCMSDVRVSPAQIIARLKQDLPRFQPPQNHFYPSSVGVVPGEVVLIDASVSGLPISTGVLVSYADDECFTLMTPQGHPESGWVTFSAFEDAEGTVCQIQGLARANDPLFEIGFRLLGSKAQEKIWTHVLTSLAEDLGSEGPVQLTKVRVAPGVQWSEVKNVRYNAQLYTLAHKAAWPFRRLRRVLKR